MVIESLGEMMPFYISTPYIGSIIMAAHHRPIFFYANSHHLYYIILGASTTDVC